MLGLGFSLASSLQSPLSRYQIAGKSPAVVADFANGVYAANGRAMFFDDLFSFSRLSAAWKTDALGNLVKVEAGEPRSLRMLNCFARNASSRVAILHSDQLTQ